MYLVQSFSFVHVALIGFYRWPAQLAWYKGFIVVFVCLLNLYVILNT
jgi:hypothetical protein